MQVSIGLLFSVWNHHYEDLIFLVASFFSSIYIQSYYSCSNGNYRVCLCSDDRTNAKTKKKSDFLSRFANEDEAKTEYSKS